MLNGQNILWSASNQKQLNERSIQSYAGAQLFPYVNRIKDANYVFNNKSYHLAANEKSLNNALHGLIFDKGFEMVLFDEDNGIIKMRYIYDHDHAGYPYKAIIENSFILNNNSLTIISTIENKSKQTIPVGHGWHPYFDLDSKIDEAYLYISASKYFLVDEQLIPTGELKHFDKFARLSQIAKTELDYCFPINTNSSLLAQLFYPKKDLTISLLAEGYPYLQVYTPSDRKSIAIEAQTSAPNAFNNGLGLIRLEPNQHINLKLQIIANYISKPE